MPPIFDKPTADRYDYIVIGGGSGGSGTSVSCALYDWLAVKLILCELEACSFLWEESRSCRRDIESWRNVR